MKKKLIWVGGIIGFLMLTILALPFLIDFNHLKPQIKGLVAEQMQADLEFSSARLAIFPNIGIRLYDVVLENRDPEFSGTRTFAVERLMFKVGLIDLIKGEFHGRIFINNPEIRFLQKNAKNNLTALVKPKPKQSANTASEPPDAPNDSPDSPATSSDSQTTRDMIEKFKNKVSISALEINHALVVFQRDDGTDVKIKDLNINIQDIGLEKDIKTHIFTELDAKAADSAIVGPLDFKLNSRITMKNGVFQKLDFDGKIDLTDLNIVAAQKAFTKARGIPLSLDLNGYAYADTIMLQAMTFQIHNIKASMEAMIRDFNALNTKLSFNLKTDEISQLADLLPQHKDLLMNGSLGVELKMEGSLAEYEKLAIQAAIDTKLSGSDFALRLNTTNLLPPRLNFSLISQKIDIDALAGPFMKNDEPENSEQVAKESTPSAGNSENKKGGSQSNTDEKAEPPAEEFALSDEQKKMLQGSDAKIMVELNQMQYKDLKLQSFSIDLNLKDLDATLNKFQVAMFGGMVRSSGNLNLDPKPIQYKGHVDLTKIDVNQLIEFVNKDFSNTMTGMMTVNLDINGEGTTKETALNALNGKGSFILHEGRFNSASIAQLMGQEVDQYTKDLNPAQKIEENYEKIKSSIPEGLLGKLNLEQEKNKITAELKKMENISMGDKLNKSRDLRDVKGNITIEKGVINFATRHQDANGTYDLNQNVKLDGTLQGTHVFTASPTLKAQLEKTTQYATLLYDDNKNLVLPFKTEGTVAKPAVKVDFAALRQQFDKNSKNSVDGALQKKLGSQKDQLISIGKEKLKAELDKLKEAAKKDSDKQKDKAKDEAKDKLKEKVKKGKFPSF